MTAYDNVQKAAEAIRTHTGVASHDAVLVLGSGLGSYVERFAGATTVGYADIPGFPQPKAVGHAGTAASVTVGEKRILIYAGRAHAYEGHDMETVVLPVRAAIAAGAQTVILTNACGAMADGLSPGDLTVLRDHINMTARNPLVGPNDERLGPRFPDLTEAYDRGLRTKAIEVAAGLGYEMAESVYAWWLGPSFETPAEIIMSGRLGADVVGMSTVPEAIAARHMGARVAGFSLVTNYAAGMSGAPLSSEEVMETADSVRPRIEAFMDGFLAEL